MRSKLRNQGLHCALPLHGIARSTKQLTAFTTTGAASTPAPTLTNFTFRLNEGSCQIDTEDRLASLFSAMVGKKMTFAELTS